MARRWVVATVACWVLLGAVIVLPRPSGAFFTAGTGTTAQFRAPAWTPLSGLFWSGDDSSGSAGEAGTGDTVAVRSATALAGGGTFSALGTGYYHSCAIRSSTVGAQGPGTLVCWGRNGGGQLGRGATSTLEATPGSVLPAGTTWKAVTGGEEVTCALQSSPTDGSVWCWGWGGVGQLGAGSVVQKLNPNRITYGGGVPETWRSISGDGNRFCAIATDGGLWCWGRNSDAEVGDGTTTHRTVPVRVESGATFSSVSAGQMHTCALAASGTVQGAAVVAGQAFCWGGNSYRQSGTSSSAASLTVPTPVVAAGSTGVRTWSMLAAGSRATCAITADRGDSAVPAGQLWCWGQLGDGGANTTAPAQVGTSTGWTSVDVGGDGVNQFCGVDAGVLTCRGGNSQGQAGDGTQIYRTAWGPVGGGTTSSWSSVSVGRGHGCALTTTSQLSCWGSAEFGQPGNGAVWFRNTLRPISSSTARWSSVDSEDTHTCALQDSNLFCWGRNTSGQLGLGSYVSYGTPQPVPGAWSRVTVGTEHTCALDTGGAAWCWGRNLAGATLGTASGNSTNVPTPVVVSGVSGERWTGIDAGLNATCGTRSDGTLWCWGAQSQGVLGNGTSTTSATRPARVSGGGTDWAGVQVSSNEHACATRTSGTLYCWGSNGYGQIGTGTSGGTVTAPVAVTRPAAVSGALIAYGVGQEHTCALDSAGVLWCWGHNNDRQFGTPANTADSATPVPAAAATSGTTWTSMVVGGNSTCAGRSDGGLWCWGHNYRGKLGQGNDNATVSAPALSSAATPVAVRLSRVSLFVLR
ncbi:hypothetical protein [Kineosporia sp. NBRC 101731]|uniref:RCC1 domain-containing protein n=1 Tax=Kineosporia sp. NBRC 101731 TaxID=3032199 RepID=UPI002553089F|nr:hypothetical protein [Kineosporia sp. NBRC 101731]